MSESWRQRLFARKRRLAVAGGALLLGAGIVCLQLSSAAGVPAAAGSASPAANSPSGAGANAAQSATGSVNDNSQSSGNNATQSMPNVPVPGPNARVVPGTNGPPSTGGQGNAGPGGVAGSNGNAANNSGPVLPSANPGRSGSGTAPGSSTDALDLAEAQLGMIDVGAVAEHSFPMEREAVGNIDFNEDMTVQVFPPYQGRIAKLYVKIGDNVRRGQVLFTIESPDLIQAESNLIAAAGVLDLTTHALERAQQLFTVDGIAEKDLQQAMSDQQTADGSLKAARDAVAVFGKSQSEIDRMVKTRGIDPYLVVPSPIAGRVTTRNAAPGDFVQPGTLPSPYSVADISRMWVNAAVTESDMPLVRKGQPVHVTLMALPGRRFDGDIATVGAAIDPQLHRGLIRAEIDDSAHELIPGMFASFVIVTGDAVRAAAVPVDGVVREGDGSMTVWVTADRRHFTRRVVKVGLTHEGFDQIIEGVRVGDRVVTKGAVFLDNLAAGSDS